ncbi:hypothetical protein DPEC_G00310440 [Dallia pectoralis]|uniref:Uncharacterized protein n=1 Tax=Dallia pectoralis TaxID=75939 RepID=A0ACC2FF77_DALPE|nr:hypothetical protein DPEC_G00310440 [Dallia pectoralis]
MVYNLRSSGTEDLTFSWDSTHIDSMEMSVEINVLVLSGAFLLTVILLTGMCLRCRRHHMPTSIHQRYSEDYIQHTAGFVGDHSHSTYNPSATSWVAPPSSLFLPVSPQIVQRPVTPTENGSIASYENPGNEMVEDEVPGSDYLDVLPSELPGTGSLCRSNMSLMSKSSQSTEPPYVNVEAEADIDNENSDAENYVNLETLENCDSDSGDSYDNYVNTKAEQQETGAFCDQSLLFFRLQSHSPTKITLDQFSQSVNTLTVYNTCDWAPPKDKLMREGPLESSVVL